MKVLPRSGENFLVVFRIGQGEFAGLSGAAATSILWPRGTSAAGRARGLYYRRTNKCKRLSFIRVTAGRTMKGDSDEYEGRRIPFIGDCGGGGYDRRFGARLGASGWGSKHQCAKQCIHSGFLRHMGAPILERLGTAVIRSRSSE